MVITASAVSANGCCITVSPVWIRSKGKLTLHKTTTCLVKSPFLTNWHAWPDGAYEMQQMQKWKSLWSWMDNFTKWASRDHSMSGQGRPSSPGENFQTAYVWVGRVQCTCSDQFLSDMQKCMFNFFLFDRNWNKLDKGCSNSLKWHVYVSFLNSGRARPKSMFQISTWNLSNNTFHVRF